MLDWQLCKGGITATGRKSTYNILTTPTGVYLVSGTSIFTPKGDERDCLRECKLMARRWDK